MADFAATNTFSAGTLIQSSQVNQNFTDVEDVFNGNRDKYNPVPSMVPIGALVGWLKTFASADSGTTSATTANKLVGAGQNFLTTISVGMIVHNTTDSTFANVTAIDSDTTLSLSADVMTTGETYTIYKTPKLADGWLEANGQTVSDSDSPYNGVALPDLNSSAQRFLRGATSSGTTGGQEEHNHQWYDGGPGNTYNSDGVGTHAAVLSNVPVTGANAVVYANANHYTRDTQTTAGLPSFYQVVWILRIK